jgi:hypothetical protein
LGKAVTVETTVSEMPRAPAFGRRELFIWAAFILFANQLFAVFTNIPQGSIATLVSGFAEIGIFQYLAWYAVFRLLWESDPAGRARRQDVAVAIAVCFLLLLPTSRMIWVAASVAAAYLWIFPAGDLRLRAAGIVLAALSVQAFWGHVIFDMLAFDLLRLETALVGLMLQATQTGIEWHDNLITAPDGYGLAIYTGCSSFQNASLALLCWVTVTKLRRPYWARGDFVVGGLVVATMILLNLARLYLMALDVDLFRYWHEGAGVQIFAVGASVAILTISLYGANRRDRRV